MTVAQLVKCLQKIDKRLPAYVVDHNVDGCGHDSFLEITGASVMDGYVPDKDIRYSLVNKKIVVIK